MNQREREEITHKLDELYKWRDSTTGLHKEEKRKHLSSELDTIVALITALTNSNESSGWSAKDKAHALYLHGKALNVFDDEYNKEVEAILSKAIKLDPTLVDAWNALGESYWKKGDLVSAKNCFSGPLSQKNGTNKVSLRCLSMVMRQLGTGTEKRANIEESVNKAKEAVALDIKDSVSWYILGNAHLTRFFSVGDGEGGKRSLPDLEAALRAYSQSELVGGVSAIADLHYNRAVLRTFKEEYSQAIEGYSQAASMDPDWPLPKEMQNNIIQYLEQVHAAVNLKGPVKPKKSTTTCFFSG